MSQLQSFQGDSGLCVSTGCPQSHQSHGQRGRSRPSLANTDNSFLTKKVKHLRYTMRPPRRPPPLHFSLEELTRAAMLACNFQPALNTLLFDSSTLMHFVLRFYEDQSTSGRVKKTKNKLPLFSPTDLLFIYLPSELKHLSHHLNYTSPSCSSQAHLPSIKYFKNTQF